MFKALLLALLLMFATPAPAGIVEVAVFNLITGADTNITTTNFAPQIAITVPAGGIIVKICIIWTDGLLQAQDGTVYFFDADPTIAANDATLTVAEAQTVVLELSFVTEDFETQFGTASVACKDLESAYHSITHAAWHNADGGTLTDEAIDLHMWVK